MRKTRTTRGLTARGKSRMSGGRGMILGYIGLGVWLGKRNEYSF